SASASASARDTVTSAILSSLSCPSLARPGNRRCAPCGTFHAPWRKVARASAADTVRESPFADKDRGAAMTRFMLTDRPLHPLAEPTAAHYKAGRLNRREFFASMAALGVSTAGTLALGGIALPAHAQEGTPQK